MPTTQIEEYSKTEAALSELRKQFAKVSYDVTTTKGMKQAKKDRSTIRSYRTSLEKVRKEIKGPALERCRMIDAEAKRITAELLALEEPIAEQIQQELDRQEAELQAKADAEQARVDGHTQNLAEIEALTEGLNRTSGSKLIAERAAAAKAVNIDSFEEFKERALDAKTAAIVALDELHKEAVQYQEEQDELARLRKEAEERDARDAKERAEREEKERVEREAREAEERKRREAEAKALSDQKKAQAAEEARIRKEREALELEKKAQQEKKEREERERIAKEAAAKEAARKAKYPGDEAIVTVLAEHFEVPENVVWAWLAKAVRAA